MRGLSRSARSALRREQRRNSTVELNLVSMIDILTVLVFFLLVNSTGVAILGINLADANNTIQPEPEKRPLAVLIRSSGTSLVRGSEVVGSYGSGDAVDYAALSKQLKAIKAENLEERSITLRLEPSVTQDALVQTMDAVRLTKSDDGRRLVELFPNIQLGDAAVEGAAP